MHMSNLHLLFYFIVILSKAPLSYSIATRISLLEFHFTKRSTQQLFRFIMNVSFARFNSCWWHTICAEMIICQMLIRSCRCGLCWDRRVSIFFPRQRLICYIMVASSAFRCNDYGRSLFVVFRVARAYVWGRWGLTDDGGVCSRRLCCCSAWTSICSCVKISMLNKINIKHSDVF